MYVVDLSSPEQLQDLQTFVEEAAPANVRFQYLVGTKSDMGVKIGDAELKDAVKKIGGKDFKVSSVTGENVEMCFMTIFKEVYQHYLK